MDPSTKKFKNTYIHKNNKEQNKRKVIGSSRIFFPWEGKQEIEGEEKEGGRKETGEEKELGKNENTTFANTKGTKSWKEQVETGGVGD